MPFEQGDEFMSEGHRFRVVQVSGRSMTAEEVATGRQRQAVIGDDSREGEADLEWLDGNPRWHEQGQQQMRAPVPKGDPPGEPIGPSRFDRDFDFED